MRRWALLLGGLVVWAAHFFALYGIASVWLQGPTAPVLVGVATLAALAVDGWLLWRTAPAKRARAVGIDREDRWIARVGFVGAALSALAVVWQGLPALIV